MGLPVRIPEEARNHVRRPLMGDLTGRLLIGWSGRPVPCLAVDVSVGGLRILAREELIPGTAMFLAFQEKNYPLVVVWSKPDGKGRGSHACGLMSASDANLEHLFVSIGWLDREDERATSTWANALEFIKVDEE